MKTTTTEVIEMIPIEQIRVINPRCRDQKKFAQMVESIRLVGLKKPIKVSLRAKFEKGGSGYDLVYGQGRIEAFLALGYKEIPAIVVKLSKEDRLLFSLMENLVRRFPSRSELVSEIMRLKEAGYNNVQIGKKIGIGDSAVGDYLSLIQAKEERLINAVFNGTIPLEVAVEISKAETPAQQTAFLKAYESGKFNTTAIRVVKRLITLRSGDAKGRAKGSKGSTPQEDLSPQEMVNMYRRQTYKIQSLVRKTKVCETKILIVVSAFKKLLADEKFRALLHSQNMADFPKPLAEKLSQA